MQWFTKYLSFWHFSPLGKSNHCYHPLKTEMLVFWAGLETSQSSVTIPGISAHLLGCWTEPTPPAEAPDLLGESVPGLSLPPGSHSSIPGCVRVWNLLSAAASSNWLPGLGLIPVLENSEEAAFSHPDLHPSPKAPTSNASNSSREKHQPL